MAWETGKNVQAIIKEPVKDITTTPGWERHTNHATGWATKSAKQILNEVNDVLKVTVPTIEAIDVTSKPSSWQSGPQVLAKVELPMCTCGHSLAVHCRQYTDIPTYCAGYIPGELGDSNIRWECGCCEFELVLEVQI